MKSKNLIYAMLIIVVALLISCEKEAIEMNQDQKCPNIIYFENFEEFYNELKIVLALNTEDKKNWEKQKGFKSLGIAEDEFYETIRPEDFKDLDEVKRFVNQNDNYIQLIFEDGEYSVETKFHDNPLRFFMNEENIIQIGEKVYKILENGIVSASIKNLDKLKIIDDINFKQFKNDPELIFSIKNEITLKSIASNCDSGDNDVSLPITLGSKLYRTYVEITPMSFDDLGGSVAAIYTYAQCQIRTLYIWWGHKTTLYVDYNVNLNYNHSENGEISVYYQSSYTSPTTEKYHEVIEEYISSPLPEYNSNPYFTSYYGMVYSDAGVGPAPDYAGRVVIECP